MSIKLTSADILEKVRKAFAPFHVVAELQDYHYRLGFRVYGENNEIIGTYEGTVLETLREPANLKQLKNKLCCCVNLLGLLISNS